MTTRRLTLLGDVYVAQAAHCGSCRGCSGTNEVNVSPELIDELNQQGRASESISISVSLESQVFLLLHSWLLPLIALVIACIASSLFDMSEPTAILAGVLAFSLGVFGCRRLSAELIKIEENPI